VLAVAAAEIFIATDALTFGLGNWDYLVGFFAGLLAGAASNGVYKWESIQAFFDAITALFGGKK